MSKSINATTPQLEAVDRFYEAYSTRDLSNAESLYSKNFRYKGLPKTSAGPDLSEVTKEEQTERLGPMLASLSKLEVGIQQRGTTFQLAVWYSRPLARFSRSDRGTGESCRPGSSIPQVY